jgi:hypothetical protein
MAQEWLRALSSILIRSFAKGPLSLILPHNIVLKLLPLVSRFPILPPTSFPHSPHTGIIYTPPSFSDHIGVSVLLKHRRQDASVKLQIGKKSIAIAQPHLQQKSIKSFFAQPKAKRNVAASAIEENKTPLCMPKSSVASCALDGKGKSLGPWNKKGSNPLQGQLQAHNKGDVDRSAETAVPSPKKADDEFLIEEAFVSEFSKASSSSSCLAPAENSQRSQWECAVCTLLNGANILRCTACDSPCPSYNGRTRTRTTGKDEAPPPAKKTKSALHKWFTPSPI